MERHLQLPDQLSCSIDLATGTGKSYVLYGIAAILLAEGAMDRVLVLCPSNTIEAGLTEKFRALAASADLRDALPASAKLRTPTIINASGSIVDGSICVENYHAILDHVKSSIRDSLQGKGGRTAVLNDECHHVANAGGTEAKKWKAFLLDPAYGFRVVVGLSGTCYLGDEYFSDVIARFSLRQAIEQNWVKSVDYVTDMPQGNSPEERWQVIHNRHKALKRKLKSQGIRPITIVITRNIESCRAVAGEIEDFLVEAEKISEEQAADKVLPVTSHKDHQVNVAKLRLVDTAPSKVEWIVSVAMLTEGWDVKNVFQIVPHEERAFNSKLLIAQVLGRGLRRPDGWQGEQPKVSVFNHDAWSGRIKQLVSEVLEIERRLTSSVLPGSPYHFDLHQIDYTRDPSTQEFEKKGQRNFLTKGHVDLISQAEVTDVTVEFETATTGVKNEFKTKVKHKVHTVEDVVERMYRALENFDIESEDSEDPSEKTNYTKTFTREKLRAIVEKSLSERGIKNGVVTEENMQRFLASIGPLGRRHSKRRIYTLQPQPIYLKKTAERQNDSCSASDLRNDVRKVFFTNGCVENLPDEQREFFAEIEDEDGEYAGARSNVPNSHLFKTPLNLVTATRTPEKKFVRALCESKHATEIDSWIKNPDQGFYEIDYAWKKGEHPKRGKFSPDFFIKSGDLILVVEIKDDSEISEPSPENIKKHEFAAAHFQRINQELETQGDERRYHFTMLSPRSYAVFFSNLIVGTAGTFASDLDAAIRNSEVE
jgi:type III restriction enzyme